MVFKCTASQTEFHGVNLCVFESIEYCAVLFCKILSCLELFFRVNAKVFINSTLQNSELLGAFIKVMQRP